MTFFKKIGQSRKNLGNFHHVFGLPKMLQARSPRRYRLPTSVQTIPLKGLSRLDVKFRQINKKNKFQTFLNI